VAVDIVADGLLHGDADIGAGWDLTPSGRVAVEQWLGAPALSYPNRPRDIAEVLDRAVLRWADVVACVDVDGLQTTYSGLAARVAAAARRLRGLGMRAGDRIAIAAGNSTDFLATIFAVARERLVLVGLNTRLAPAQWAYMLRHSDVRGAFADQAHRGALETAAAEAGLAPDAVRDLAALAAPDAGGDAPHGGGTVRGDDGPRGAHGPRGGHGPRGALADDATYAVVYTSGTTGRPKASQVVHRCSVHSAMSYQRILRLGPADRTAVLFPLYYISAMHAHVLPAMLGGARMVFADPPRPRAFVRMLAEQRITWAYAVPSWWMLCVRDRSFTAETLPHLRVLAAGGAPFPATLVEDLRARLPRAELLNIYGLSETHSPGTVLLDGEFAGHPGSVGRALPCMEIAVRDERGRDLPAGEVGEIWLRGSLVTTGYAGDPAATAEAIRDGWFCTGDVGRVNADGFLFVLDRTKDMINRAGHKVFSAEVEEVLRRHPHIADAAVVAGPDALAGEAVVAFVVPADGASVDLPLVRSWVTTGMAEYAAPSRLHVVDALPRNAVGKTDKLALRARLS
jgi:long-chain acyl-CoA synthetase